MVDDLVARRLVDRAGVLATDVEHGAPALIAHQRPSSRRTPRFMNRLAMITSVPRVSVRLPAPAISHPVMLGGAALELSMPWVIVLANIAPPTANTAKPAKSRAKPVRITLRARRRIGPIRSW